MYALDLSRIPIDTFEQALLEIELIPSRRVLKDHISSVVATLRARDVHDLEALRRLLKAGHGHAELALELGVDEDYLLLLTREVNSYVTKAVQLARFGWLSDPQLERLGALGITSSRDLYERAADRLGRDALASQAGLSSGLVLELLELSDLVRVTGIGPASALAFRDIGIRSPGDYLATDSARIQARYADWTAEHSGRREVLGISDIDYCRRYAAALDDDIER